MRPDASEQVWLTRSNLIEWVVYVNGTPQADLTALTQVQLCIGAQVVDSDTEAPGTIWWTDTVVDLELPDGTLFTGNVLRMRLGMASLLPGEYEECRAIIFSAQYVDGLVLSDNLMFVVHEACAP